MLGRLNRLGMTMMELLIVIVMIGIMAAMVVPRLRASPRRMVQESARQLARDIDLVRGRALSSKRSTRLKLVGTTAWIGYRDVEGDALISEVQTAPEVRRRIDEFGLYCDITDLAACEAEVRAERERWTEYTRVAGIQPE